VAASSAAVKSAYDSAISANAVATNASNVATSASNQAFGIASLSNGDVLLTGNLRIPADANIYKGTDVFSSGGGGGGTSGIVSSASNIVPTTNGTLDLGAPDLRWRNLYLSGNMISFGNGMNIDGYSWSYLANYVVPPRVVANTVSTYLFTGAAQDHSAYVRNGELFVCGRNDYGQLGLGHTSNTQVPTKVPGIANAALVACGERFTVCVKTDGTAVSAGLNANGQLGINSLVTSSNFVGVAGVSNATAVAAGYTHTLFMTSDGKVVACGSDANGQLGRGASSSNIVANSNIVSMLMPTPQNGEAPSTFRARSIAAGGYHSTVLLENGSAYLCGKNDQGQCGASPTLVPQANTLGIVPSLSNVVDVACGHEHTLFVRYDGQVVGFGRNDRGQLGQNNKVSPITSFVQVMAAAGSSNSGLSVQVAAGFNHSAIIKADNTIWMVGANDKGQLGLGQGVTEALTLTQLVGYAGYDIACGRNHTVISTTPDPLTFNYSGNNALIAFGDNTYGQMGDNNPNITTRWFPNRIHDGTFRKRLMVGSISQIGSFVDADGVLYVTGANGYGQLGDETTLSKRNFRPVSRLMNEGRRIVAVACGNAHTVALDSLGQVHAWGFNSSGQLGNGNTTSSSIPIAISGFGSITSTTTIVAIACGWGHTLALDSLGKVHAWGDNGSGQLGRNNTTQSNIPINISSISNISSTIYNKTIVAIACGYQHTFALDSLGKVHVWGRNANGELGNNTAGTPTYDSLKPIAISDFGTLLNKTIVAIACGGEHTLALDSLGKVHAWGRNIYGNIGNGTITTSQTIPITISTTTPSSITNTTTIVAISAGWYHTLALDSLGKVHAWGKNTNGQLGNGNTTSSSLPIAISTTTPSSITNTTTIVAIACGGDHTLALDSFGKVHAWGDNSSGRLGINSTTSSSVPVLIDKTARDYHSRIISTGRGNHKLLTNISASTSILKSVGTNSNRQIGDSTLTDRYTPVDLPTFASAIVSTSESLTHSAVALANGEVWCWGANGSGQCGSSTGGADVGVPTKVTGITNAVEVACGDNFTLVRNADDTVMAFGLNTSGQLGIGSTTSTHTPTLISTLSGSAGSKMIAAGSSHAASVDGTGTLRVWGSGALGKLGLGNVNNVTSPTVIDVSVFGFNKVTHVSLGDDHTVVVCSEATGGGVVYTAGLNDQGQLGRSDGFELLTPGVSTFGLVQNMPTSATPLRAACGAKHTALHVASDRIVTFGSRVNRQTVVSGDAAWMPELVEVIGEGEVAYEVRALSVSPNATHVEMAPMTENESGYGGVVPRILTMGNAKKWGRRAVVGKMHGDHSIVVASNGIVYAAGRNYYGQLGNNIATASTTVATSQVNISSSGTLSGKTIVAIACGQYHTVALDSLGQVHAWGYNPYGQLGRNNTTQSNIPINISEITGIGSTLNGKTIVAIACGEYHTLALDSTGQVHAWGRNSNGQLGRNNTFDSTVPINISEITGIGSSINGKTIVAIACGGYHTLALDS
jgi:alpha-tubulin suppressor-like RCC1 family protein